MVRVPQRPVPAAGVRAPSSSATTCCVQAFRVGRHLGVQFHPELDARQLSRWFDAGADRVAVETGAMPSALLAETRALRGVRRVARRSAGGGRSSRAQPERAAPGLPECRSCPPSRSSSGAAPQLRGADRRRRRELRDRRGHLHGAARPERRGQDDDGRDPGGLPAPRRGRGPRPRRGPGEGGPGVARAARDRAAGLQRPPRADGRRVRLATSPRSTRLLATPTPSSRSSGSPRRPTRG